MLNVVFGDPALISRKLLGSPITRGLTFTGSTRVGKQLGALAVQTMKKMTLELGGHAPVLIFGDVDPEAAAISAVGAKFRNSGQVCTSPTRFLCMNRSTISFAARLAELANKITVGDGFAASTKMGPLAHERRVEAIERFVEDARSRKWRCPLVASAAAARASSIVRPCCRMWMTTAWPRMSSRSAARGNRAVPRPWTMPSASLTVCRSVWPPMC